MSRYIPFAIAPLTTNDIPSVVPLEKAAYPPPTPQRDYFRELSSHVAHYLALRVLFTQLYDSPSDEALTRLIGVAGYWLLSDEVHVVTIAIDPHWKGIGLGEWLFIGLLEAGQAAGGKIATLEVRPSNHIALALYQKYRFREVGRRAAYYSDNEDALILTAPPFDSPAYQALLNYRKTKLLSRLERIELDKFI